MDYEIVEFDRPRRILWRVTHQALQDATDTYRLTPTDDGGTAVEYRTDFSGSGLRKANNPIASVILFAIDRQVTRRLETELQRLPNSP